MEEIPHNDNVSMEVDKHHSNHLLKNKQGNNSFHSHLSFEFVDTSGHLGTVP